MQNLSPPLKCHAPPIPSSHRPSSPHNPQFLFTLSSNSYTKITIHRLDNIYHLGHCFYLLRHPGTELSRCVVREVDIIKESEIVDTTLDITMECNLQRGNYIVMPAVYDMDEETGYSGVQFSLEISSEIWGAIVRLCLLPPFRKRELKGYWRKGLLKSGQAALHNWNPFGGIGQGAATDDSTGGTNAAAATENNLLVTPASPTNSTTKPFAKKLNPIQVPHGRPHKSPNTMGTTATPSSAISTTLKKHLNIDFENPQFILRIKQRMEVVLRLICDTKEPNDTMNLVIVKGIPNENKMRHQLGSETNIVYTSPEKVSKELLVKLVLEPSKETPYIILAGSSSGNLCFKLILEYSECYQKDGLEMFASLPLPIMDSRRDSSCEDVTRKYINYGKRWCETNCVDQVIAYCEENNYYFRDHQFTPDWKSINLPQADEKTFYDEWRRPSSFLDAPDLVVDGIDVEDMVQGELDNAWLLQAVAACALYPDRIHDLFYPSVYSPRGIYSVRLFIEGKFQYVLVDDFLPTKNGSPVFAHSKDSNELWASLLEKAVAKVFGSYARLETVRKMHLAFVLLTGGFTRSITIARMEEDHLWELMENSCEHKWLIGALSKKRRAKFTGLISDHFYCILQVKKVEQEKLVHLYNVWGWKEWKGDFSDGSLSWTKNIKNQVGAKNEEDGLFWMRFEDFVCHFNKVTLCKVQATKSDGSISTRRGVLHPSMSKQGSSSSSVGRRSSNNLVPTLKL